MRQRRCPVQRTLWNVLAMGIAPCLGAAVSGTSQPTVALGATKDLSNTELLGRA